MGLYTSPHLLDFRERIRINGEMISEQFVVDFVEKERPFFEPLHPSFFEITTALALHYFAVEQVDISVVEVGLGRKIRLYQCYYSAAFDHHKYQQRSYRVF